MNVVRRPAPSSVALAAVPGAVGVAALAPRLVALVVGVAGLVVLVAGTALAARAVVTTGGLLALSGCVVAGIEGMNPALLLLATAGTVVAWTTAQHVVGLAQQLGRDAEVLRSVVVHLASTAVATLVAGGATLAVFLIAGDGLPPVAVVFLLAGVVLLFGALEL